MSSEYDEEEEEEEIHASYFSYEDCIERDDIVADIICGGEELVFRHNNKPHERTRSSSEDFISPQDSLIEEEESFCNETETEGEVHKSPQVSDFETEEEEEATEGEIFQTEDADSVPNRPTSPITLNLCKSDLVDSDKNYDGMFILLHIYIIDYIYTLLYYSLTCTTSSLSYLVLYFLCRTLCGY